MALKFPGSAGKESACNVGDLGSIPGLGRSPGEGIGYPLQYSGVENSMNWIVHRVTKSWRQLSDFHFHFEIAKKKCHTFLHFSNKEVSCPPPTTPHHKKPIMNSLEGPWLPYLASLPLFMQQDLGFIIHTS